MRQGVGWRRAPCRAPVGHLPRALAAKSVLLAKRVLDRRTRSVTDEPERLVDPAVKICLVSRPLLGDPPADSSPFVALDVCSTAGGLPHDSQALRELRRRFPDLVDVCAQDVREIGQVFARVVGCRQLEVKLEYRAGTPCTRFHMDHVSMRALCTYVGPGTVFVPSEACRVDDGRVLEVLEHEARSAQPGDLLFLKGSACGGDCCSGGAVHRSPLVAADHMRLVLTCDPVG